MSKYEIERIEHMLSDLRGNIISNVIKEKKILIDLSDYIIIQKEKLFEYENNI
jgi:hypothetical protein